MAAQFEKFRSGWLANRKSSCASLLRKAGLHVAPDKRERTLQPLQVNPALVCTVLKAVRVALDPVLPPAPMFVLTDYKTANSDANNGSFGLTTWGATFVRQPCRNVKEWWHEPTCPKTEKVKRIAMFLFAKYCNSDWVIAPVLALLLRELLPWPSARDAEAAVGVVEFPADPTLPVYQFLDESGNKQFMRSKTAEAFHCVRLGSGREDSGREEHDASPPAENTKREGKAEGKEAGQEKEGEEGEEGEGKERPKFAVVDIVRGFHVADKEKTNHKLVPVDVDLALFLLFRNAKMRRLTDVFEAALDDCQKRVMAVLAAQKALFAEAVKPETGAAAKLAREQDDDGNKDDGNKDDDGDKDGDKEGDKDDDKDGDKDDDDGTPPPPPTPEP